MKLAGDMSTREKVVFASSVMAIGVAAGLVVAGQFDPPDEVRRACLGVLTSMTDMIVLLVLALIAGELLGLAIGSAVNSLRRARR